MIGTKEKNNNNMEKERKRSKRHRRARHKTSRKDAVEAMKSFVEYTQEVQRRYKARFAKPTLQ